MEMKSSKLEALAALDVLPMALIRVKRMHSIRERIRSLNLRHSLNPCQLPRKTFAFIFVRFFFLPSSRGPKWRTVTSHRQYQIGFEAPILTRRSYFS